jgi:hypothetical protein
MDFRHSARGLCRLQGLLADSARLLTAEHLR